MTIQEYLLKNGKADSWLNLADQFGITGTNKQKSDKVRRIYNSIKGSFDPTNILVIGDLHCPFELKGYLEFCLNVQRRFNCGKIIFIGDILDQHFSSYHDTNADGFSAGQELDLAIQRISKWYKAFPNAVVTIGNHDRLVHRKNTSAGVSKKWIRDYKEVLETPNWEFVEEYVYDNILFVHGEQSNALTKAHSEFRSVVSGHLHTEGYVKLLNGGKNFAMQVGTGIDFNSYAFGYAQRGKQPILSCGVICEGTPIIVPFNG